MPVSFRGCVWACEAKGTARQAAAARIKKRMRGSLGKVKNAAPASSGACGRVKVYEEWGIAVGKKRYAAAAGAVQRPPCRPTTQRREKPLENACLGQAGKACQCLLSLRARMRVSCALKLPDASGSARTARSLTPGEQLHDLGQTLVVIHHGCDSLIPLSVRMRRCRT